jgi:hypothetical protein
MPLPNGLINKNIESSEAKKSYYERFPSRTPLKPNVTASNRVHNGSSIYTAGAVPVFLGGLKPLVTRAYNQNRTNSASDPSPAAHAKEPHDRRAEKGRTLWM